MKIILLGAGQVGSTLAENLASEANITAVDIDGGRLRALQDRLDIRTLEGKASHPSVLEQAGAEDADMLIAVTNSDEVNMIACQLAYTLFHTPTKIARIREHDYLSQEQAIFADKAIPIDVLISPEQLVTEHINRLIQFPGALQVLDFAGGRAGLVAVKACPGGPLVGHDIASIRQHMPKIEMRVAAIFRQDRALIPKGDTLIEADDEVFFIAAREDIRPLLRNLRRLDTPYQQVLIAGGGNIGARLAATIEGEVQVKIIERDPLRGNQLAKLLNNTVVLNGSASDRELLIEENIEDTDLFIALTNDDEVNVMASMLAKQLGARTVMTLINNPAYVELVQGGVIDIAISPQQTTISSLLTHVRRGDVAAVHALRRGAAEVLEVVAHGDKNSSRVVGRPIAQIRLPPGSSIGAIVRDDQVLMVRGDVVIEEGDHVILFLVDKRHLRDVEDLFQVGLSFF